MASPQSAYVTAVSDDYNVEQTSSSTNSETSESSPPLNWDLDAFAWPEINGSSLYTNAPSPPKLTTSSRLSSSESASATSQSAHFPSQPTSMSQKWQQIITSNDCPQSLIQNPILLNEITKELLQRDQADFMLSQTQSQQAFDEEQRRRRVWAMEMILKRPQESAEVCAVLRKVTWYCYGYDIWEVLVFEIRTELGEIEWPVVTTGCSIMAKTCILTETSIEQAPGNESKGLVWTDMVWARSEEAWKFWAKVWGCGIWNEMRWLSKTEISTTSMI